MLIVAITDTLNCIRLVVRGDNNRAALRSLLMSNLTSSSTGEINANSSVSADSTRAREASATYEAPAIESVVTFDNLQREVLYAGSPQTVIIIE